MTNEPSNLWGNIISNSFSNNDYDFVNSFGFPKGTNARLAAWDLYDKSIRYYKFLLYDTCRNKLSELFEAYRSIENINISKPVSVNINDCDINIDHLLAVEETQFIRIAIVSGIRSVVEIGAGFGKTCQALLSINPSIEIFTIIDLPEVFNLSKLYPNKVIHKHIDKVEFIDCGLSGFKGIVADFPINIDYFER